MVETITLILAIAGLPAPHVVVTDRQARQSPER